MPNAKVSTAAAVNTGDSRNWRRAYRKLPGRLGINTSPYSTKAGAKSSRIQETGELRPWPRFGLALRYGRWKNAFVTRRRWSKGARQCCALTMAATLVNLAKAISVRHGAISVVKPFGKFGGMRHVEGLGRRFVGECGAGGADARSG